MSEFLKQSFFNNTVSNYLWFLGVLVSSILIIQFLKTMILKRILNWTAKRSEAAEIYLLPKIRRFLPIFLYVGAFYLSLRILVINSGIRNIIDIIITAIIIYLVAVVSSAIMDFGLNRYSERNSEDTSRQVAMHWVSKLLKGLIWVVAAILFLENMNIQIGALVAGLGIGGIAIAFAAQAILEDIFSYFTIFFDRPFEVGDFIITGDYLGTVEFIGIRTTRLRSISGEQLIFPNKDLTNARVKNYKAMEQRRVVFTLGVTYDTTLDKLKEIPSIIKEIIEGEEDTRFDRTHFFAYGDSCLKFEIVYYVLSGEYNKYMDIQQNVNFKIKQIFEEKEIEFAYPTQTLYMQNSASLLGK